ncbi:MAG: hypothetical protein AAGG38_03060 [Planctomycetota bacterium]
MRLFGCTFRIYRGSRTSGGRASRASGLWAGWAATCVAVLLGGCIETRIIRPESDWPRLRDFADAPRDPDRPQAGRRGQAWAIELKRFEGRERLAEAYKFADLVRREGQIGDVWFLNRGSDTVVFAGRYHRANDPDAQERLAEIKRAKVEGKRPFRKAKIVEVDRRGGQRGEYDLAQFSGYRTLVVAAFDREFGSDFRAAAERYAAELRTQHADHEIGFEVYYYHGPNQSLVSAGLFTQADFVSVNGVDRYGPAIRELQLVFAHSLRNGEKVPVPTPPDAESVFEPTVIVRVP